MRFVRSRRFSNPPRKEAEKGRNDKSFALQNVCPILLDSDFG